MAAGTDHQRVTHPPERPRTGQLWALVDTAAQVVAGTVLVTIAGLLLWSSAPLVVGWTSSVVISGSMSPQLRVGDVVVTSPVGGDDVVPGQVVLFPDPSGVHRTLVHRVESVDDEGRLITRGDANGTADSTPLERSAVEGLGRLRIPFVGLPRLWWQNHDLLRLVALGVLLLGASTVLALPRDDDDDEEQADGADDSDEPVETRGHRRGVPVTAVTAVTGALALLAPFATTPRAEASFTGVTTTSSAESFTAGTVAVSSSPSAASFSVSGWIPGDSAEACLTATYGGSLGAMVKLRAAPGSTGSLAPYLQTTVQEGTTSAASDCTGFTATSTLFTGRLDAFLARTTWASAVGSWSPTTAGQTHVYRVTFQLRGANVARNQTSAFGLVVEAQNT